MRIYIERSESGKRNRIYLRTPYDARVVSKCKQIPGASWSKTIKAWSYPLDLTTCAALRREFGNALDIGPELWQWATAENERRSGLNDLLNGSQGHCPRVEAQEPKLAAAFAARPYQATGAAFISAARAGILGDDPGLGKTLEMFGAVIEAGYTEGVFLVFCPSSAVRSTWQREIEAWMPNDIAVPCDGTRKQRNTAFETLEAMKLANAGSKPADRHRIWFICNIEMARVKFEAQCPGPSRHDYATAQEFAHAQHAVNLQDPCDGEYVGCPYVKRHKHVTDPQYPQLFEHEWDGIIVDESQKAIAGIISRKQKQSQQRVGFGMLREAEGGLRTLLSGTPWRGKPQNFWSCLNWLFPERYTGAWRWIEYYFDIDDNGFGRKIGDLKPEREDEWNAEMRSVMIRRTKPEVAPDLPPKMYAGTHLNNDESLPKGVWLEMEPAQATTYRKFSAEAAVRLADGATMWGNGTLSEIGRLRQLATAPLKVTGTKLVKISDIPQAFEERPVYGPALPSNKFNWIVDFLTERGIAGDVWGDKKVIIASNYTKTINLFRAELERKGVLSHCLTGETSTRNRARMVAEFQGSGGPRVFFLNAEAGGTSLTLDAADDIVKIDRTWNPDTDTQVEDRGHRVSRIHQVTVYNLYSLGTVEEEIALTADSREDVQKTLLDGARGVAFARKLLGMRSD
jgi:SNF2 family DNA or RNA helicase